LPLSSLYSEGGAVGCIDVVIQRTYPIQVWYKYFMNLTGSMRSEVY